MPLVLILASALASQAAAIKPIDISTLKVTAPQTGVELDLGKLKGDLREICWSTDGKQIYVQTADGDSVLAKQHHFVVSVASGAISGVDVPPSWATEYWNMKSYKSAPGIDALEIQLTSGRQTEDSHLPKEGVRPADGGVTFGATNPTMTQNIRTGVVRLRLLDETVGEFVDSKPVPGLTFGWGPENSGAIAYVDHDGRVMLMDQRKQKTSIAGTKDAVLPAWSADGAQIAYAQKAARRKYVLMIATVTR